MTGILTNSCAIADILHRHGALSFWDFAAAGPYVDIEMYPQCPEHPLADKDAVFISPHKFVGGPGTPGVLVVRRSLLHNRVPDVVGGGTVAYVNPTEHRYLDDPVHREEGGTPAIIESIRAGLVFQLKDAVGVATIREHEESYWHRAVTAWSANPAIQVLGNTHSDRLSILSFVVKRPGGRYLHHNFVVALLSDLFGIQSRGGCSCAGPYGHRLLGIDIERSHEFEQEITHGCEGIKPGWTRVSFNYFISEAVFQYLVDAVDLVAEHGWKLLPEYRFDPAIGTVAPSRRPGRAAVAPVAALLRPDHRRSAPPAPSTTSERPRPRWPDTSSPPGCASTPRRPGPRRTRARERCRPRSSTCAGSSSPTDQLTA